MTRHVLLIPAPGDRAGLLNDGVCGARGPCVDYHGARTRTHERVAVLGGYDCAVCEDDWAACPTPGLVVVDAPAGWGETPGWLRDRGPLDTSGKPTVGTRYALVLAWEGKAVDAGCDCAIRALAALGAMRLTLREHYTIEDAITIARACEMAGLGTAVVVEGA